MGETRVKPMSEEQIRNIGWMLWNAGHGEAATEVPNTITRLQADQKRLCDALRPFADENGETNAFDHYLAAD
ncbi:MAG: hypothetical protein Q7O66_09535, partial [Dehalococcoidia bacterium]|nr:hypothetical protein [Dehalococcoidia bacterium]